jgi:ubiquinone/menaquinone biosynthesis C-methylase UbiE
MARVPEQRLACPRCRTSLPSAPGEDRVACPSCSALYERAGGVLVLLPDSLSPQQRAQLRYFDSEFAAYGEEYAPENWRLSFSARIFEALELDADRGPYLDVGVGGSGATVIEAARRGVESTGCDLSLEGVVHARSAALSEGVGRRTCFVVCAAESLPFPDASFGCASAVAVLEHLDDDAAAAGELARVVRPGALVWITVPLAYRYILPPLWPAYLWHDRRIGHKRHYDEAALVRLFGRAGFRHVATAYTGHAVKVLQLLLDRLLPLTKTGRDRLWWSLERRDLHAVRRAYGALQLSAVFRREAVAGGPA